MHNIVMALIVIIFFSASGRYINGAGNFLCRLDAYLLEMAFGLLEVEAATLNMCLIL